MISDYIGVLESFRESGAGGLEPTCEVWGTVMPPSGDTRKGNVRVRVSCMREDMDIFDNVSVLTNYGGAEYGNLVLPEEGDTVKLSFIGGDWRNPVVTGCRYPEENEFLRQQSEDKELKKTFRTKSGGCIAFSGEKQKDRIEIAGSGKLLIRLNEEEKEIFLGDQEEKNRIVVDAQKGEIMIGAKERILVQCGKSSIELNGDGSIRVSCNSLELEAKNINVKAGGAVKMKGQEITLDSSMGMKLSAGSLVKVSGRGGVKISGATVQLN